MNDLSELTAEEIAEKIGPVAERLGLERVALCRTADYTELLVDKGDLTGCFAFARLCGELEEALGFPIVPTLTGSPFGQLLRGTERKETVLYERPGQEQGPSMTF